MPCLSEMPKCLENGFPKGKIGDIFLARKGNSLNNGRQHQYLIPDAKRSSDP
jgi:hypothetical protein